MTRVVTIMREPHIAYSYIDENGQEIYDHNKIHGLQAIWDCDLKVYVQYDNGEIGLFSAQYDECLCHGTADDLFLRPISYIIKLEDVDEFVEAMDLVDKEGKVEARKYVIELLKKYPSTPMSDEVREMYGIPKPLK